MDLNSNMLHKFPCNNQSSRLLNTCMQCRTCRLATRASVSDSKIPTVDYQKIGRPSFRRSAEPRMTIYETSGRSSMRRHDILVNVRFPNPKLIKFYSITGALSATYR
jgi:hypothetical protein